MSCAPFVSFRSFVLSFFRSFVLSFFRSLPSSLLPVLSLNIEMNIANKVEAYLSTFRQIVLDPKNAADRSEIINYASNEALAVKDTMKKTLMERIAGWIDKYSALQREIEENVLDSVTNNKPLHEITVYTVVLKECAKLFFFLTHMKAFLEEGVAGQGQPNTYEYSINLEVSGSEHRDTPDFRNVIQSAVFKWLSPQGGSLESAYRLVSTPTPARTIGQNESPQQNASTCKLAIDISRQTGNWLALVYFMEGAVKPEPRDSQHLCVSGFNPLMRKYMWQHALKSAHECLDNPMPREKDELCKMMMQMNLVPMGLKMQVKTIEYSRIRVQKSYDPLEADAPRAEIVALNLRKDFGNEVQTILITSSDENYVHVYVLCPDDSAYDNVQRQGPFRIRLIEERKYEVGYPDPDMNGLDADVKKNLQIRGKLLDEFINVAHAQIDILKEQTILLYQNEFVLTCFVDTPDAAECFALHAGKHSGVYDVLHHEAKEKAAKVATVAIGSVVKAFYETTFLDVLQAPTDNIEASATVFSASLCAGNNLPPPCMLHLVRHLTSREKEPLSVARLLHMLHEQCGHVRLLDVIRALARAYVMTHHLQGAVTGDPPQPDRATLGQAYLSLLDLETGTSGFQISNYLGRDRTSPNYCEMVAQGLFLAAPDTQPNTYHEQSVLRQMMAKGSETEMVHILRHDLRLVGDQVIELAKRRTGKPKSCLLVAYGFDSFLSYAVYCFCRSAELLQFEKQVHRFILGVQTTEDEESRRLPDGIIPLPYRSDRESITDALFDDCEEDAFLERRRLYPYIKGADMQYVESLWKTSWDSFPKKQYKKKEELAALTQLFWQSAHLLNMQAASLSNIHNFTNSTKSTTFSTTWLNCLQWMQKIDGMTKCGWILCHQSSIITSDSLADTVKAQLQPALKLLVEYQPTIFSPSYRAIALPILQFNINCKSLLYPLADGRSWYCTMDPSNQAGVIMFSMKVQIEDGEIKYETKVPPNTDENCDPLTADRLKKLFPTRRGELLSCTMTRLETKHVSTEYYRVVERLVDPTRTKNGADVLAVQRVYCSVTSATVDAEIAFEAVVQS